VITVDPLFDVVVGWMEVTDGAVEYVKERRLSIPSKSIPLLEIEIETGVEVDDVEGGVTHVIEVVDTKVPAVIREPNLHCKFDLLAKKKTSRKSE